MENRTIIVEFSANVRFSELSEERNCDDITDSSAVSVASGKSLPLFAERHRRSLPKSRRTRETRQEKCSVRREKPSDSDCSGNVQSFVSPMSVHDA